MEFHYLTSCQRLRLGQTGYTIIADPFKHGLTIMAAITIIMTLSMSVVSVLSLAKKTTFQSELENLCSSVVRDYILIPCNYSLIISLTSHCPYFYHFSTNIIIIFIIPVRTTLHNFCVSVLIVDEFCLALVCLYIHIFRHTCTFTTDRAHICVLTQIVIQNSTHIFTVYVAACRTEQGKIIERDHSHRFS